MAVQMSTQQIIHSVPQLKMHATWSLYVNNSWKGKNATGWSFGALPFFVLLAAAVSVRFVVAALSLAVNALPDIVTLNIYRRILQFFWCLWIEVDHVLKLLCCHLSVWMCMWQAA
jgi:hypothetical protein